MDRATRALFFDLIREADARGLANLSDVAGELEAHAIRCLATLTVFEADDGGTYIRERANKARALAKHVRDFLGR